MNAIENSLCVDCVLRAIGTQFILHIYPLRRIVISQGTQVGGSALQLVFFTKIEKVDIKKVSCTSLVVFANS
jgi:hypothetical protein